MYSCKKYKSDGSGHCTWNIVFVIKCKRSRKLLRRNKEEFSEDLMWSGVLIIKLFLCAIYVNNNNTKSLEITTGVHAMPENLF